MGIIIRQESRLLELYPPKVYSEQKGMSDEERVLGNEDKSEQKGVHKQIITSMLQAPTEFHPLISV